MFKVSQAHELTCHRTINAHSLGRPCLGDKCSACVPPELKMIVSGEDVQNVSGLENTEWRECKDISQAEQELIKMLKHLSNVLQKYQLVIIEEE